jgi:hypothetical protein
VGVGKEFYPVSISRGDPFGSDTDSRIIPKADIIFGRLFTAETGWGADYLLSGAEGAKWTNYLVAKALPHSRRQDSA